MAAQNSIRIRLDLRVPRAMHECREEQSLLTRLSYEGLILACIRAQMEHERGR